jgi:hypothetical protein
LTDWQTVIGLQNKTSYALRRCACVEILSVLVNRCSVLCGGVSLSMLCLHTK